MSRYTETNQYAGMTVREKMALSTYLDNGMPRWGFCHHGEANGFCDRGGCDEFWVHQLDEEARRNRVPNYPASAKQVGFMRSLVAKKDITSQEILDLIARLEAILAEGKNVNGYKVSQVISHAKYRPDKTPTAEPKVTITISAEATPKQVAFIKVLLAKKVVSAEAQALNEANPTPNKQVASKLIGLLNACPDKPKDA